MEEGDEDEEVSGSSEASKEDEVGAFGEVREAEWPDEDPAEGKGGRERGIKGKKIMRRKVKKSKRRDSHVIHPKGAQLNWPKTLSESPASPR